jgi:hypothetical protein
MHQPNIGEAHVWPIMMRLNAFFSLTLVATFLVLPPARAQDVDADLKIYAVSVINVAPYMRPFRGYGIYLGQGRIITAAHVVGHWSLLMSPRIMIAGQELPSKVVKKGSFEQTDLALLTIDEATLPVSLRLRRNPLCKTPPKVGMDVVVVYPDRTTHSRVIPPTAIPSEYRTRFSTLIAAVQGSGSGAFDADKKCLLGIMSASVGIDPHRLKGAHAGYFVPASKIADFIPAEFRF